MTDRTRWMATRSRPLGAGVLMVAALVGSSIGISAQELYGSIVGVEERTRRHEAADGVVKDAQHIAGHPESGTAIQAQVLANALQVAGVPVKVVAAEGKTHNTLDADLGVAGDASTNAVFEFLEGVLKQPGPSLE